MPSNKGLIFKKVPQGLPVPGQDLAIEPVAEIAIDSPPEHGLLIKSLFASFDPYMRGRMRPVEHKSYTPAYHLNTPIDSFVIGQVIQSDNPAYQTGQLIIGQLPIQEYVAIDEISIERVKPLKNPLGLPDVRVFLGPLGMPGLTAYSSFYEIGKPKKGDTIFISAASGAVGQIVAQLAKREGLRVIGSVGSDDKLNYIIDKLGFDGGFNYKCERPRDALARLAPEGLDIYYDDVGGEHLEAALDALNNFGRIVACGMISDFSGPPYPVKNLHNVITKRLAMRGFIVSDQEFGPAYSAEHQNKMQQWIMEGSIQCLFHETVGIEHAVEGLVGIFQGKNKGKALLRF
ncbi:hypothetical protein ASPCAL13255 [Aspergillus calidoustus]|uniref:Enoyl reductase (ER) domain-containing protein n=1 Tax=Aspergillus calidoustus TaxID=454130 RepID=A0A0U5GCX2_ASPCI|nr:hypothetical protein ASPCAL13255 [Aspergillus calidoustus]